MKKILIHALPAALILLLSCLPAVALDYEELPLSFEIKGYPGTGNFQTVYAVSINERDSTVSVLAAQPLSLNVFGLSRGEPLRQVRLREAISPPAYVWNCGGPDVILSSDTLIALGPDGKHIDDYKLPQGLKPGNLFKITCTAQGGLLALYGKENKILVLDAEGKLAYEIPSREAEKKRSNRTDWVIGRLFDAAVDPLGGIYALDGKSASVKQYDYKGLFRKIIVAPSGSLSTEYELQSPALIAVDTRGNVWLYDAGNRTIKVYDNFGYLRHVFRDAGRNGFAFLNPAMLRIDNSGRLFILDAGTNSIKVFNVTAFN